MSTVISAAQADITTVVSEIKKANDYIDSAEADLNFDNKNLEEICKNHAKNVYRVLKHLNKMKALEELFKSKLATIESKYWKKYNENYARALSARDIQQYIAGEPEYTSMIELQLEVNYVKRQLEAIYEALKDMGWQIKYVTDLRIAELQDVVV
jgi:hypothetical protein